MSDDNKPTPQQCAQAIAVSNLLVSGSVKRLDLYGGDAHLRDLVVSGLRLFGTIYTGYPELAEIEARDKESADTWFSGPGNFTAMGARDRRALLVYLAGQHEQAKHWQQIGAEQGRLLERWIRETLSLRSELASARLTATLCESIVSEYCKKGERK